MRHSVRSWWDHFFGWALITLFDSQQHQQNSIIFVLYRAMSSFISHSLAAFIIIRNFISQFIIFAFFCISTNKRVIVEMLLKLKEMEVHCKVRVNLKERREMPASKQREVEISFSTGKCNRFLMWTLKSMIDDR